jgi:hypothetical protein
VKIKDLLWQLRRPPPLAYPAAFGDLVAAVLALTGLVAVLSMSRFAGPFNSLFNVEGTLDLVTGK